MLPNYVALLVLAVFAVGFGVFTLAASWILGRPRPTPEKRSTYECGVPPIGNARQRFPLKFFLVCMVFILFDVDAAFLYPWALVFQDLGSRGMVVMSLFVAVLAVADIYAWKVGALDW